MTDRGGGMNNMERRVMSVVPIADRRVCTSVPEAAVDTRVAVSRVHDGGTTTPRVGLRTGIAGIVR
jgi:hypothetical protein